MWWVAVDLGEHFEVGVDSDDSFFLPFQMCFMFYPPRLHLNEVAAKKISKKATCAGNRWVTCKNRSWGIGAKKNSKTGHLKKVER